MRAVEFPTLFKDYVMEKLQEVSSTLCLVLINVFNDEFLVSSLNCVCKLKVIK